MAADDMPTRLVTLVSEILSSAGLPGGTLLAKAVEREMERRKNAALELLIDALKQGDEQGVHIDNEDAEQFAGMMLRFMSAAKDGAARKNLRLMARLVIGLKREGPFEDDQFQRWAGILKDMTALEIEIIAECYRVMRKENVVRPWADAFQALSAHHNRDDILQSAAALLRTGLLVPDILASGMSYEPSSAVLTLGSLASFERGGAETADEVDLAKG